MSIDNGVSENGLITSQQNISNHEIVFEELLLAKLLIVTCYYADFTKVITIFFAAGKKYPEIIRSSHQRCHIKKLFLKVS